MKEKRNNPGMNSTVLHGVAALCLVLLLVLVIPFNASASGGVTAFVPERPEMVDIEAYESLMLKADTLEQSVRFDNLIQNNCWLGITLVRGDGTELWKSQELMPGQVLRSITLNEPLASGEYNGAFLRYQHWTYDEKKEPINGAEVLVKLIVVPDPLEVKAGSLEQTVHFENPIENNCWLVITLSLPDGTALWKSEEMMPGQTLQAITLNHPLAAGEYGNAVLRFQQWSYDEAREPLDDIQALVNLIAVQ